MSEPPRTYQANTATDVASVGTSAAQGGLELARRFEDAPERVHQIAWSPDGSLLAAAGGVGAVAIWSATTGELLFTQDYGPESEVMGVAWHPSQPTVASGSEDGTVRLLDARAHTWRTFCKLDIEARFTAWSPDGSRLAITDRDGGIGIWDAQKGVLIKHARVHDSPVNRPWWSPDGQTLVTCGNDGAINVLASGDLQTLRKLRHDSNVWDIALSPDGRTIASASEDRTVRIWDLATGANIVLLEHKAGVFGVRFSPSAEFLASMSDDRVQVWRCRDWVTVASNGDVHNDGIGGIDFHPSQPLLAVKNRPNRRIDCYRMDAALLGGSYGSPDSRRYVNAKVVLLGDTGVGKSGLGLVLSGQPYQPTDSTHGRNVWDLDTQEVEAPGGGQQTREVLLWDLAGQPGYRLVHQLHLSEVAVALVVFDSRSETDPFSGVKYWVRALAQARRLEGAAAIPRRIYLVAARTDRGGIAVRKERIQAMLADFGLDGFFETSAKEGWQVAELGQAIRDGIAWDSLPMVSSTVLFDSIKQFLLEEKQAGRLLSTADDLYRSFCLTHPETPGDHGLRTSFETCIGRVESRGLIQRLHFGDLVLLQPELLDSYASAMVQSAKEEPDGLGFIPEEEALAGRFRLADSERVRDRSQEKLLLIATVEEMLRYEIALKEMTDRGVDLVFPSQFTRERPDAPDIPGKEMTFTFEGSPQSIYATLAVRLSHSRLFQRQAMWQNAASYTATDGGVCGINLRELEEGCGELSLFYNEQAGRVVRSQFESYVLDHLQLRAIPGTITHRRVRACGKCGYVLPDDLVRLRLQMNATTVNCPLCDKSVVSLIDQKELHKPAETVVAEMNRSADEYRDKNVADFQLKGKIETGDYDVFMCYNSKDVDPVMAIGKRLKEHGILPWLDIWEIPPGTRWQKELQKHLNSIKAAAIFIGPKGAGPWQELEVEALLGKLVKRGRPMIPVILDGRRGHPRLPTFLGLCQVVDMRKPDPDPFAQLVWGITRQKPSSF